MKGIYKITNKINGKVYIGQSMDIERRWEDHKLKLQNNSHHSQKLQENYNSYGENNFKFEIIEEINEDFKIQVQKCILYILENKYIKQYDSINNGYNIEDTLDLILKGKRPFFNSINKRAIYVLKSVMKNINKNNGVYIPMEKKKRKRKQKPKEEFYLIDNNINYILNKCKNYIFEQHYENIGKVLEDNGFNKSKTYQLLRDVNLLDNKNNKCLIDDENLFKNQKYTIYNKTSKNNIYEGWQEHP